MERRIQTKRRMICRFPTLVFFVTVISFLWAGGVFGDTNLGDDASNVTVHANSDDGSYGAFIVYSGTGTTLPTAELGSLNSSTITAYTNGSATNGATGAVGGQLVIDTTGVHVTTGTLTVGGSTVATQSYVTSQGYITSSALSPYATTSTMNSADSALQSDIDTRVITGSAATFRIFEQ